MDTVILMRKLSKIYKKTKALDEFSIDIMKGDIYGLIGPNGAGKSTFIKVVTGLTLPTSGELQLFDSTDLSHVRKQIGSVIEMPAFFKNMTAEENLYFYCKQFGRPHNVVEDCLKKVNLCHVKDDKKFGEYSLGMKQRLGIAFALMNNPQLVILDEPTNGLDPVGIAELRDVIKELHKNGVTFIISSHILSELSQIATKFGIMDNGRLVREFTKDELSQMTNDKIVVISSDLTKLQSYLKSENMSFEETGDNMIEIVNAKMSINTLVKNMVKKNITIDGIYQQQASLEDIFFEILHKKGGIINA